MVTRTYEVRTHGCSRDVVALRRYDALAMSADAAPDAHLSYDDATVGGGMQ